MVSVFLHGFQYGQNFFSVFGNRVGHGYLCVISYIEHFTVYILYATKKEHPRSGSLVPPRGKDPCGFHQESGPQEGDHVQRQFLAFDTIQS